MISISHSRYRFLLSGLWIVVILGVCFMPDNGSISAPWAAKIHLDKIGHFVIYTILGILLMRDKLSMAQAFLACFLLGLFIELVQGSYLTTRHFEFMDIIANISGCFTGIALYNWLKSKKYDK